MNYFGLGSPPQVRGKQRDKILVIKPFGITPAGAGKTSVSAVRENLSEDHPRRCGENQTAGSVSRGSPGSPPQVRGKPDTPADDTETDRITPAGAGKTFNRPVGNSRY